MKRLQFGIFAMALATSGTAFAFGGAGAGVGGGGVGGAGIGGGGIGGGFSAHGITPMAGTAPGFMMNSVLISPRLSEQRYRDLKVAGRIPVDESKLPDGARIIRLHVNGVDVPMRLDTENADSELEFLPDEEMARELYRSILNKRIEVVGDSALRDKIIAAEGTSKSIEVEGYVFDRLSPYLVVKGVEAAK